MTFELTPAVIPGLREDEVLVLRKLADQLGKKQQRNQLLSAYYDGHAALKDLGISLPPSMRAIRAALGWPAKAVRALAHKHAFEGFSLDGVGNPFELDEMLQKNRFELDLLQGITSAYKHACSFIVTTLGDEAAGQPKVMVQVRDAEWSTAIWDPQLREITAFLAVISSDELGSPTEMTFMMRSGLVAYLKRGLGRWEVDRRPGVPGRLMVEMLTYDPQLSRPFGRSRITREVRYLTDAAVRTLVRSEVSAEFFAAPQRYVLGAEKGAFKDGAWSATMGRFLALDVNEDGEKPDIGQFPQLSMGPHLEHYRQLAQNFCAATNLPPTSVGIFADNPQSAEAMQAAEAALAEEAETQWRIFKPSLVRTAQNIIMLREGLSEPPAESWRLRVNHKPARFVSPQAAGDFVVKAVAAVPAIADTTQALRGLGFSDEEIEGMQSEWRRARAGSVLDRLAESRVAGDADAVEA